MAESIGGFTFDLLLGNVPEVQEAIEVITKPGEAGHRRRLLGKQSADFTLESLKSFSSLSAARTEFRNYALLTATNSVQFEKDGFEFSDAAAPWVAVSVLHVSLLSLEKKACIAGTNNKWLMRNEWLLKLTPLSVPL